MLGRRYGDFDAALIWNLHARHLTNGERWRSVFIEGASGNAAYPYGLPALVAFGWRLVGGFSPVVPYALALLPTVCIPVMIYLQTSTRSLIIGAGVLAAFGLYPYYIALGLDQYADIQIAWLLLLTAVCIQRRRVTGNQTYALSTGLLLGALCWTKYEGILLAGCVLLWHIPLLRHRKTLLLLLLGVTPFAVAWVILRQAGAPPSPLVQGFESMWLRVSDASRYGLVARQFWDVSTGVLAPFAILMIAYPALSLRARLCLSPLYGTICTAVFGYVAVYLLLVTTDLDWNLRFSLPRLLLQLYPTLVFITAMQVKAILERRALVKSTTLPTATP
jgi:hypothetical protein